MNPRGRGSGTSSSAICREAGRSSSDLVKLFIEGRFSETVQGPAGKERSLVRAGRMTWSPTCSVDRASQAAVLQGPARASLAAVVAHVLAIAQVVHGMLTNIILLWRITLRIHVLHNVMQRVV
jgi:hypothetical protein